MSTYRSCAVPLIFALTMFGCIPGRELHTVFRFDRRGTGMSGGEYGCCENEDALAAYRLFREITGGLPDEPCRLQGSCSTT
jgi:alpha/beta superfamily hydrolase